VTAHYEEWKVAPELDDLVACVWAARFADSGEPHVERVIPDGCIDLIYTEGALIVAGPDTHGVALHPAARAEFAGLRFRPGVAPALLGVPASELVDQRVDADCLLGASARRILEQLEAAGSRRARAAVLEAHVQSWMRHAGASAPDRLARAAAQRLKTAPHDRSVASLANELGVSERKLHRRFVHALGYGPKMFARIARLQRFLAYAAHPPSAAPTAIGRRPGLAELALAAGYADQPHLTRECRALAGVTPSALIGYPVTAG
jgi:AraC-like DNA-binding protein